ncbi:hypothetical protein Q9299_05280 [Gemmobacter fulvus]|uniref:hypothetical protein n=1 Tax=Gemmobacter fulvus TaxID=2840474 RepID=UPI002796C8F9|nr:hypothetical protein [Gemmobacter fulvus]MDQ1847695.1 hypothetical protein [Gemmobacter fulvus]
MSLSKSETASAPRHDGHQPKPGLGRYKVRPVPGGYRIADPEGELIGKIIPSMHAARVACTTAQREADAKAKRGPRPCMCCGTTFDSEGIHNRLCHRCGHRGDSASMSLPANSIAKVRHAAKA